MITIMEVFHKYIPRRFDGSLLPIPTHGSVLDVDIMVDAQASCTSNLTDAGRFEGLEPTPLEYDHRKIMLQVDNPYQHCSWWRGRS